MCAEDGIPMDESLYGFVHVSSWFFRLEHRRRIELSFIVHPHLSYVAVCMDDKLIKKIYTAVSMSETRLELTDARLIKLVEELLK